MSAVLTADIAVLARGVDSAWHLLLIQRDREPYKGMWALPGGKVESDEPFLEAAIRELDEETGVRLDSAEFWPLGFYSHPDRDVRGRYVSSLYIAVLPEIPDVDPGSGVASARWHPFGHGVGIPQSMAFDHDVHVRDVLRVAPRAFAPVVRRVVESDVPAVIALHHAALRAAGADAGPGPWDDDLEDIGSVYIDSGGDFLVAACGPVIVGMGALRAVDGSEAEVKRMRVMPRWQGQGIGRLVYGHLEARARELGFERLVLDTTPQQHAAISLYSSVGFIRSGTATIAGLSSILFQKKL